MSKPDLDTARASDGPDENAVRCELRVPAGQLHLQPIVKLPTREVVGYEALSRFPRWTPERWFRRACDAGLGLEFELAAVRRAVSCLGCLPDGAYLGVNVSASTLVSETLLEALADVDGGRVVLELTEREPILDYGPHRDQVHRLRERGMRIAIDDVGAGHSSLLHIIELRPDFIKLDRALIARCDRDAVRRVLMQCLDTLARHASASLVAEGVETQGEADAVAASGVRLGQGFLFGRPQPHQPGPHERTRP